VLDALGYLHQRKIVHRDISPDNIMLARDVNRRTQVKLIDLGIAKALDAGSGFQTKKAMFIGKLRYASPEQLGGSSPPSSGEPPAIDGRSDLYSLGIVLYELLTGFYPIRGADESSVLAGQLFHPPLEFDATDPQGRISEPLREVLLRALAKAPDDRFQTAEEFRAALRAAASPEAADVAPVDAMARTQLSEQPTTTAVPSPAAPPGATVASATEQTAAPVMTAEAAPARPPRRGLAWAAAGALALVLAIVAAIGLWPSEEIAETAPDVDELAGIDFGTYKALVIGNDDYAFMPDLETASHDARDVAQILEDRYGFRINLLLNADRSTIVNALYELTSEAGPTENLLVYYAGHGSLLGPGGGGAWLPVDAQPMEDTNWVHTRYDVNMALEQSNARHVLVLADSCYSSSLAASPIAPEASNEPAAAGSSREAIVEALRQPTRLILAAGELKPIPDSAGDGHSVFTGALLEVLETNQGLLNIGDLFSRLQPRVHEASERLGALQRPQLGTLDGSPFASQGFFFLPSPEDQAAYDSTTSSRAM